jgi:hypothetical protein
MQRLRETQQYPIASFPEQQVAEDALDTLVNAGFDKANLILTSQTLKPTIEETEATQSAKAGAIVGALLGGIIGFLLGYVSLYADFLGAIEPVQHVIGLTLAGSGIGTAASSLIAAISGANVVQENLRADYVQPIQGYIIFWTGSPEEVTNAQTVLQGKGLQGNLP